ncbi:MAG: oligosaccharide flippase family protein [Bacteroidales bacterium]|nr:oligosaccharide flippase family protein [Bacteroidales bacterium]
MWQKVITKLQSEVAVNSAKLLSANIITQIIGLLVYPIITRLYTPEDFGLINLFLSIAGVLSIIATAELQYSIVLPKEDNKAIACLQLGIATTLVTTIIVCGTIPFAQYISQIFKTPSLAQWYWAIPIFVFLSSLWNLLNYWCTRNKFYNDICLYQCTQSIANAGAKCGFGYAGLLNGGLIFSAILSPFIALTTLCFRLFKREKLRLFPIQKTNIQIVSKEYANFPKYSLPRALLNYLSGNLPILLLTPFFGLTEIGFLGLALTLGFRPINIISNSIYQVFYQKTSKLVQNRESIRDFHSQFIKNSVCIFLPLSIIIFCFSSDICSILLGNKWAQIGIYINAMMIWLLVSVLAGPISYLPDIFQKQKIGLFFEVALFAARLIALLIGIFSNNFLFTIFLYSIFSFAIITIQLFWFRKLIHNYESSRQY